MPRDSESVKKPVVTEPLLPAGWKVPQSFRDRLGDEAGRQRLMETDGHLLLVLHAPPKPGERTRRGRLFWRNAEGQWKPQGLTHSEHAIGELLAEYESVAGELEDQIEVAESARNHFEILSEVGPLVRSAHNLSQVLQDARTSVKECRKLILLRDRAYSLSRRLELLQQDAKNTLDFVIARRSEEQAIAAERQALASHRLNVLAALFFPLATMMAVFGANVRHGLEPLDKDGPPLLLFGLIAVGLALGAALAAFIGRK